jgi:hypothetical protein
MSSLLRSNSLAICEFDRFNLGRLNPQKSHDCKMNLMRVEEGVHRHPTHVAHTSIHNQYQKSKHPHNNRNHHINQSHADTNEVHLLI